MKEYKFIGTNNHFIFATLGGKWYKPTHEQVLDLKNLSKKYKMSAEDLCLIPFVHAVDFPKVRDDDYLFFIRCPDSWVLTEKDIFSWNKAFSLIGKKGKPDDYPIIIGPYGIELERCKSLLVLFR